MRKLLMSVLVCALIAAPAERLSADATTELQKRIGTQAPVRDRERTFQAFPKNQRQLRVQGVVLQERDFSCGAAALSTVLQYQWGGTETETQILNAMLNMLTREEMLDRFENGLTLTDLRRLAAGFGYQTVIGRLPVEKLRESKIPLIVGITTRGYNHFIVFRGMDDHYVYTADPSLGKSRVPIDVFTKEWQRNAVLVVVKPGANLKQASGLMVTEEEKSLGSLNRRFLQNQVVPRMIR